MRKKKTCDYCSALSKEFTCKLGYVMHVTTAELLGALISMPAPDEPCPKPKTATEFMYWKTKR